ncbi:hypothetical protein VTK73DRAFT_456 [Phialemonium thermophilum]|uniref:Apple domain-containing protein n=1 Tax=Phialemonium thermophilum TaxID=223376 RepID=A0ABR3VV35_9PEZI
MHKTTPEDMVALWRWEHGRRQKDTPLLYRDLFEFRHPGRPARLQNWDNGDWARFAPPKDMRIDSADACAKACEAYHDCAQWLWRGLDVRECVLMRQIRYGVERAPETLPRSEDDHNDDKKEDDVKQKVDFTSGWMTARIDRWKEEHRCDVIQWVGPSITRIF